MVLTFAGCFIVVFFMLVPMLRTWHSAKTARATAMNGPHLLMLLQFPHPLTLADMKHLLKATFGAAFDEASCTSPDLGQCRFTVSGKTVLAALAMTGYLAKPEKYAEQLTNADVAAMWELQMAYWSIGVLEGSPDDPEAQAIVARLAAEVWTHAVLGIADLKRQTVALASPELREQLRQGNLSAISLPIEAPLA